MDYNYDNRRQLLSTTSYLQQRRDYTYRFNGLHHSKTSGGDTSIHLWSGSNIVAELDVNGDVKSVYMRGINLISADDKGMVS